RPARAAGLEPAVRLLQRHRRRHHGCRRRDRQAQARGRDRARGVGLGVARNARRRGFETRVRIVIRSGSAQYRSRECRPPRRPPPPPPPPPPPTPPPTPRTCPPRHPPKKTAP